MEGCVDLVIYYYCCYCKVYEDIRTKMSQLGGQVKVKPEFGNIDAGHFFLTQNPFVYANPRHSVQYVCLQKGNAMLPQDRCQLCGGMGCGPKQCVCVGWRLNGYAGAGAGLLYILHLQLPLPLGNKMDLNEKEG